VEGTERIKLDGHAVPCGIALSADGKTAYVALSLQHSVALICANERQVERLIPVGGAPFGVAVSDYMERAFAASTRGYAWNMADALTG
jgi:YVTN family beta-propeller protein